MDITMFSLLKKYLIQQHRLSIPGLGTILVEKVPARLDIVNKEIQPPLFGFRFDKYFDAPDRDFFQFLATNKGMVDYEAIKWYAEWAYELKREIRSQEQVIWEGVGVLKNDINGEVVFIAESSSPLFFKAVKATKIIRQNQVHQMLVGEKYTTSTEMTELLGEEKPVRRSSWWITALILGIITCAILFIHFYQNGFSLETIGNTIGLP